MRDSKTNGEQSSIQTNAVFVFFCDLWYNIYTWIQDYEINFIKIIKKTKKYHLILSFVFQLIPLFEK